jgi:hypothetical protein
LAKGTTPLSSLPYEAGDGTEAVMCGTVLAIPDLIVRRGKKLL